MRAKAPVTRTDDEEVDVGLDTVDERALLVAVLLECMEKASAIASVDG